MEGGALGVGDHVELGALESHGDTAQSARPAPPGDVGLTPGVACAGGDGSGGDIGAGDGGGGPHHGDIVGGETGSLVIVRVLQGTGKSEIHPYALLTMTLGVKQRKVLRGKQ